MVKWILWLKSKNFNVRTNRKQWKSFYWHLDSIFVWNKWNKMEMKWIFLELMWKFVEIVLAMNFYWISFEFFDTNWMKCARRIQSEQIQQFLLLFLNNFYLNLTEFEKKQVVLHVFRINHPKQQNQINATKSCNNKYKNHGIILINSSYFLFLLLSFSLL